MLFISINIKNKNLVLYSNNNFFSFELQNYNIVCIVKLTLCQQIWFIYGSLICSSLPSKYFISTRANSTFLRMFDINLSDYKWSKSVLNIWCNQSQIGNSLTTCKIPQPIMWYAFNLFKTFLICYKSIIFRCGYTYSQSITIGNREKPMAWIHYTSPGPCVKMPGGRQLANKFVRWGRIFSEY